MTEDELRDFVHRAHRAQRAIGAIVLEHARRAYLAGATHECSEWMIRDECQVCGEIWPARMPDVADDAVTEALARELEAMGAHQMEVVLRPASVLQMVGLVQLALRHQGTANSPNVVTTGRRFIDGARAYFAACPTVLDVIEQGDDPSQDRPW